MFNFICLFIHLLRQMFEFVTFLYYNEPKNVLDHFFGMCVFVKFYICLFTLYFFRQFVLLMFILK